MRITSRTRWLLLAEMLGLTIVLIAGAVLLRPAGSHLDGGGLLYGVAQVVVLSPAAAWVHTDMDARGRDGLGYALAVVIVPPIGLVLWWLMRARPRRAMG